eukprot:752110-Hanusia_phi.AAC.12
MKKHETKEEEEEDEEEEDEDEHIAPAALFAAVRSQVRGFSAHPVGPSARQLLPCPLHLKPRGLRSCDAVSASATRTQLVRGASGCPEPDNRPALELSQLPSRVPCLTHCSCSSCFDMRRCTTTAMAAAAARATWQEQQEQQKLSCSSGQPCKRREKDSYFDGFDSFPGAGGEVRQGPVTSGIDLGSRVLPWVAMPLRASHGRPLCPELDDLDEKEEPIGNALTRSLLLSRHDRASSCFPSQLRTSDVSWEGQAGRKPVSSPIQSESFATRVRLN